MSPIQCCFYTTEAKLYKKKKVDNIIIWVYNTYTLKNLEFGMREGYGVCPVCNGTCRMPVPEYNQKYKHVLAGYDKESDTLACNNCGGQTMYGRPTGEARLRKDGTPCTHEYTSTNIGRCLTLYTCKHCDSSYEIDSGD